MKWGRKNWTRSSSSSSSSLPTESFMSRAFSVSSWLSKLTQSCGNFDKMGKHERRYGYGEDYDDDDAFGRISIEDDIQRRIACNVGEEKEAPKLRELQREKAEILGFDFKGSPFSNSTCSNPAPQDLSSEWERLKILKVREFVTRNEEQKKLPRPQIYRAAEKKKTQQTHSPTDLESSRIGHKMKMKTTIEENRDQLEELESMAIVKNTLDPSKDFHDSMVEMITEKRITSPGQLEELLACYLTLNSDEYHQLIINVFRQVWLETNQEPGLLPSP